MPETEYLIDVVIVLIAAVIMVSLSYHLRLGAVIGYLVAGALIGPHGLALVGELDSIRALAELGVVFLLFTVGLELPFSRIRVMRGRVFALGGLQVLFTTLAIAAVAYAWGASLTAAIIIGGSLAFSSTAIVLRLLSERGELTSQFGRSAFAVLIIQDLAVAVFLVSTLAIGRDDVAVWVSLGLAALKVTIAMMAILGIGRIVMRHVLTRVAMVREREIFTAMTLFIALGTGLLTGAAGLSMAFGAFLAGMLLAESPYRHQVAADIQPFRGLLLGLFFMSAGMFIDLSLLPTQGFLILAMLVGLILGKAVILAGLARLLGYPIAEALQLGLLLSQAGEFAFVLLAAGLTSGSLTTAQVQPLTLAVALSMFLTPFLAKLGILASYQVERHAAVPVDEIPEETENLSEHVVIAGYGRVGEAVAKHLATEGRQYIAIDLDPHRIAQARSAGQQVYYGDATQPDILSTVQIDRASAVVVAVSNPKAALQIVAFIRYLFPNLQVLARAQNRQHALELEEAGAHVVIPELVATGQALAGSLIGSVSSD